MKRIASFNGEYRWLSNFSPAVIELDGAHYASVEHAYQAAKTFDPVQRVAFQENITAGEAKRLGKYVTLRRDWEAAKLGVMLQLLKKKFELKHYRDALLATGEAELVEGNTWGDTFWGVCRGKGENHLGQLLMHVRSTLQDRGSLI